MAHKRTYWECRKINETRKENIRAGGGDPINVFIRLGHMCGEVVLFLPFFFNFRTYDDGVFHRTNVSSQKYTFSPLTIASGLTYITTHNEIIYEYIHVPIVVLKRARLNKTYVGVGVR